MTARGTNGLSALAVVRADVAQLEERHVANVEATGSSPVVRLPVRAPWDDWLPLDLRTKEGRCLKRPRLRQEAIPLREQGFTMLQIGRALRISPSTASVYLPWGLAHLDSGELSARRESFRTGVPLDAVLARRRYRAYVQHTRWMLRRDARRRVRLLRLDAPVELASGSISSKHEIIAQPSDPYDPQRWVESELLDELVGDLSIAEIQGMSDEQLRPLRMKLIEAGFARGQVQQKERERLRVPLPRRGDPVPASTFESMATDHKHRKPGHRSSAGGVRNGRKPRGHRGRNRREKVVW